LLSEQIPFVDFIDPIRSFTISPDGRRAVYASVNAGIRQLYMRDLGAADATPIPGTENGEDPFFAPDGKRLGFWVRRENALKVIGIDGGSPLTLGRELQDRGATWLPDDSIIYSPSTDALPRGLEDASWAALDEAPTSYAVAVSSRGARSNLDRAR